MPSLPQDEHQRSATASADPFENFDLKAEAAEARDPRVRFAFEFPRMLADFRRADAVANAAKTNSRRMGYLSVALVLSALLIASSFPVQHELHFNPALTAALGYMSAGIGLVGAILAFVGMHGASPRRIWLRNRLRTEMTRLFHFHYLAARLPELARAGDHAALREAYMSRREAAYTAFLAGPLANPEAELARISARADTHDFNVVEADALTGAEDPPTAALVLAAWKALRIDWQRSYVEAMLAHRTIGKRASPLQTEHAFSRFAWICVAVILALHLVQAGNAAWRLPHAWIEVGVVWTALVALAARAIEDGLQPQRDVERYEQYRANIQVAAERFEAAETLPAKLEVVRAFERTSLEEMRIFMCTHARSRFML
jgi:hypothetical protein